MTYPLYFDFCSRSYESNPLFVDNLLFVDMRINSTLTLSAVGDPAGSNNLPAGSKGKIRCFDYTDTSMPVIVQLPTFRTCVYFHCLACS
eukprot:SAG11_NODE_1334_length_5178_cov_10.938374_6_plen_89_part_00